MLFIIKVPPESTQVSFTILPFTSITESCTLLVSPKLLGIVNSPVIEPTFAFRFISLACMTVPATTFIALLLVL